jgi:hypothetical protein
MDPQHSDSPGQELAPRAADGETTCQAETPSATGLDWYCVAASGHDGDHVAWAFGAVGHTWPQDVPGPFADDPAERVPLPVRPVPYDSPGVWVERDAAVQGVSGRDEITPATTSAPAACDDCGGRGNVPNIHARDCRHYAVREIHADAGGLREALATYTAAQDIACAPGSTRAEFDAADATMSKAANAIIGHARFLLREIDRLAGA